MPCKTMSFFLNRLLLITIFGVSSLNASSARSVQSKLKAHSKVTKETAATQKTRPDATPEYRKVPALGSQYVLELFDCDREIIDDLKKVEEVMVGAAKAAKATIVGKKFHKFSPQGVSGVVVIAESHLAIHTWPEHGYCAVDVFTCGDRTSNDAATEFLKKNLKAKSSHVIKIDRGLHGANVKEDSRKVVSTKDFEDIKRMVRMRSQKEPSVRNVQRALCLRDEFKEHGAWGMLSSVDLRGCDPKIIRSAEKIKEYVVKLCDLIEMKRFGDCQVVHFGEDEKVAGFSMTQLIETSLISGHFANLTNTSYLDIFSCKYYDPIVVAEFSKKFFKADSFEINVTLRK